MGSRDRWMRDGSVIRRLVCVTRLPRETYLNDVDLPFVLVVHDLVLSLHDL